MKFRLMASLAGLLILLASVVSASAQTDEAQTDEVQSEPVQRSEGASCRERVSYSV